MERALPKLLEVCFRKSLLDSTIRGEKIIDIDLDKSFNIREARLHLEGFPIKHENVISYICERYEGDHKLMNLLKRRVGADRSDLKWFEFWNPESIELIVPEYREFVKSRIIQMIPTMDDVQIDEMKGWNMEEILENQEYKDLARELKSSLSSL